jgi:hypothetical protein
MEAKEIAKNIRKELKEINYTNKQVKVKTTPSQAINVDIIDWTVINEEVKQIAAKYESFERDEITGEILAGGNTFVFVNNKSINPNYINMGNILLQVVEENKGVENDKCVAFVNDGIKIHLIDISENIPKYIIETKYNRTTSRNLTTAERFAKHLSEVEI